MWLCGQFFSSSIIERIQQTVDAQRQLSRRELSRRVCRWLDWRTSSGELQEGSCRKALIQLHRQNKVSLPETENPFTGCTSKSPAIVYQTAQVRCDLQALGEIELIRVGDRRSQVAKIWKAMLEAHHYLGSGPLCGAQIKYVIRSESAGYLGALAFSSACWSLKARDDYIGWDERARLSHLNRVITNSRFLIVPGVRVENLASHVLSMALKAVVDDWQQTYHVTPVLVETFVDGSRFDGSCYRAANWRPVGQSSGRHDGQPKEVYLHPLCARWRAQLCAAPAVVLGQLPRPEAASWAEEEFATLRVHDERLKRRLYTIAEDF